MAPVILFLLVVASVYALAFKYAATCPQLALLLLVAGGAALRIYAMSDGWLHSWDERYHALVAKHLAQHMLHPTLYDTPVLPCDYRSWTLTHTWLHKPPMALWLIALSIKLLGNKVWVVRVPSLILSLLGIKLTYDIANSYFGGKVAFIAAFLFSIQGLIIELAAGRTDTDHIDVVFMFFVLLGAWLAVKYCSAQSKVWLAMAAGAAMGAAVLTKWLPGLVILPVWLMVNYNKVPVTILIRDTILLLLCAAVVAVPWQVYIFTMYPAEANWELMLSREHFSRAVEGHDGSVLFYINELRIAYGELVYLPVAVFIYKLVKERQRAFIVLGGWWLIVFGFYSVAATKMAAYTLIAAPATIIMTAWGYDWLWQQRNKLVGVVALGLLVLPVRYTIERLKPFDDFAEERKWNDAIVIFARSTDNNAHTVVVNCPRYIELMYATECVAYDRQLTNEEMEMVNSKGYRIVEWRQ